MKRLLIMLLVLLLPLQTTWAAMSGVREVLSRPSGQTVAGSGAQAASVRSLPPETDKKSLIGCCAGCHVFCNFSVPVSPTIQLPLPVFISVSAEMASYPTYQSPIPEEPLRPKWIFVGSAAV